VRSPTPEQRKFLCSFRWRIKSAFAAANPAFASEAKGLRLLALFSWLATAALVDFELLDKRMVTFRSSDLGYADRTGSLSLISAASRVSMICSSWFNLLSRRIPAIS
jgi:hypothetical protein